MRHDEGETINLCEPQSEFLLSPSYTMYQELVLNIKSSLQSSRKRNPEVKISMSFDKLHFDDEIRLLGIMKGGQRGVQKYTIKCYSDLEPLLGKKSFFQGMNEHGDFVM